MNNVMLRPKYIASVSGGKDSLYMLAYILAHLDKYPLDYVVHFELEIDYPFIKKVIESMENICKDHNIPFMRIKPRKSWEELYAKYSYPTRMVRWCNSKYKMDCQKQLNDWLKSFGCRPVMYIGFCYNETKRFKYTLGEINENNFHIYPLAEEKINESTILEWAKNQDIYNDYYKINTRCGCMGCPMSSMMDWAYLYNYYPDIFYDRVNRIKSYENKFNTNFFYYDIEKWINNIQTKWTYKLKEKLELNRYTILSIYDFIQED